MRFLLLMMQILHDLIHQDLRKYGSIIYVHICTYMCIYIWSCGMSTINFSAAGPVKSHQPFQPSARLAEDFEGVLDGRFAHAELLPCEDSVLGSASEARRKMPNPRFYAISESGSGILAEFRIPEPEFRGEAGRNTVSNF